VGGGEGREERDVGREGKREGGRDRESEDTCVYMRLTCSGPTCLCPPLTCTHTHTHMHTDRQEKRERERARQKRDRGGMEQRDRGARHKRGKTQERPGSKAQERQATREAAQQGTREAEGGLRRRGAARRRPVEAFLTGRIPKVHSNLQLQTASAT